MIPETEQNFKICPLCGGNACYSEHPTPDIEVRLCFGCGYSTSTLLKGETEVLQQTLNSSPTLHRELQKVDQEGFNWFPATISLPEKGIVFADGTQTDNWKWTAMNMVEIPEDEKSKFPEGQTHKMDTSSSTQYEQRDFMTALEQIEFYSSI